MQTTTKSLDPLKAIKAANKKSWDNLSEGIIELRLSRHLVEALKTLHARGVLNDLHSPEVHMQSLLYAAAIRRERDTRHCAAGTTTQLPSLRGAA